MYAVVKTGGKQYRVEVGSKLKVERFRGSNASLEIGDTVHLDTVLLIGDNDSVQVGNPTLDSTVEAKVLSYGRGKKLRVVKFRRRQNSRTRTGHRQNYLELEITAIGGKAPASKAKKASKKTAESSKSESKSKASSSSSVDDLSKISGVGPVIVGKLEKLGITTFKQIAEFSDEDIARVDGELNFKGRIERDNWVQQAKDFLAAK